MGKRSLSLLVFLYAFVAIAEEKKEEALPEFQNPARKHDVLRVLGVTEDEKNLDEAKEQNKENEGFKEMEDQLKKFQEQMEAFEGKYGFPLFTDDPKVDSKNKKPTPENPMPSEMNWPQILGSDAEKQFHDKNASGSRNKADKRPTECDDFAALNPEGITFVQPSKVGDLGAVLFGGQACSGVKRRSGVQNNWPNSAADGSARMTPNGVNGKHSSNFDQGAYGSEAGLEPIWLGDSGAVQIHSLRTLKDDASLAGVSSMGCLVVNQNCMKALNDFLAKRTDLKFRIVTSDGPQSNKDANDACTRAVNKPMI